MESNIENQGILKFNCNTTVEKENVEINKTVQKTFSKTAQLLITSKALQSRKLNRIGE